MLVYALTFARPEGGVEKCTLLIPTSYFVTDAE